MSGDWRRIRRRSASPPLRLATSRLMTAPRRAARRVYLATTSVVGVGVGWNETDEKPASFSHDS